MIYRKFTELIREPEDWEQKERTLKERFVVLVFFSTVNNDFYLFDTDILLEHSNGAN